MAMGIRKVGNTYDSDWYKAEIVKAERGNREHLARYDRSFNAIMAKADAKSRDLADGDEIDRDDDAGTEKRVDHHASTVADLLVEAGTHPDRSAALGYLMHSPHGAALLGRMSKAEAHTTGKDHPTMDKTTELRAIAKAGGIIAVAKAITDENRSYGITEHEFVELATEHAKAAHPDLTEAAAFAKLYQIPEVWRACAVLKAMPFQVDLQPLVVGGESAQAVDDPTEAIAQLKQLGARKWPTATEAQQFANAFTDPVNRELAAKAHRRPSPTTKLRIPEVMK
jgi:hypothetical protein